VPSFKSKIREEKALEGLTGYPEFLRILMVNRGIKTKEEAEAFLLPDYEKDLPDPFLLKDMDKAVERILTAIKKEEKIVIFSDYDADGIPGAVILHDFFEKINYKNFTNYIPHRDLEGFGLNEEAIDEFKKDKVKLIITVDCGIADLAEAEKIHKHKIDLIITDHHEPKDKLPKAVAVIDPKRADCKYPFKDLCGAAVAFKLVQAILVVIKSKKHPLRLTRTNRSKDIFLDFIITDGWEKWLLDVVGIATLSDMVPLIGENRALAHYGLKVLRKSPRIGLMKLLSLLKIKQSEITEDDIGFSISPRINAASRMGNPEDAFKLFVAKDEVEADTFARHLDHINNERKGVVASMVKEVRKIMKERLGENANEKKVVVIGNPDWKPSLLGLVANSLVDDHSCPVFLWGRDGGNVLKGSCRSDGSVSLIDLMMEVEVGIFEEFGGHTMSGGFSVVQEKVHLLEEKLQISYEKVILKGNFKPEEPIADMKISLDQVSMDNYKLLEKLAPFGVGNPKPLFLFEGVIIENVKMFGKEVNHLEVTFKNSHGKSIKAIGFFMSAVFGSFEIKAGDKINLLANFERSTFRGFTELRLRIVDLEFVL
jgi:single-stranded-DNA-specific exonuclease